MFLAGHFDFRSMFSRRGQMRAAPLAANAQDAFPFGAGCAVISSRILTSSCCVRGAVVELDNPARAAMQVALA